MTETIRSLEGLRGLAAIGVALLHLEIEGRHLSSLHEAHLASAYLLVDLFFVLSGFVIARAYERRLLTAAQLGNFMVRRAGRLYPLFVFSTVAYIVLNNLSEGLKALLVQLGYSGLFNQPANFDWVWPTAGEILSAATLTHSLGFFDRLILNYPSWSISVEYYTYLIFGVCAALLAARVRPWAYTTVWLLGVVVAIAGSLAHDCIEKRDCLYLTTDLGLFRSLAGFFLGVLAARLSDNRAILARLNSTSVQMLALLAVVLILIYSRKAPVLAFFTPFAFFLLIVSVASDRGAICAFLGNPFYAYLGRISYSIYLMHALLLVIFAFLFRAAHDRFQVAVVSSLYVATILFVSTLTFRFIEEPFRRRANLLADRLFFAKR